MFVIRHVENRQQRVAFNAHNVLPDDAERCWFHNRRELGMNYQLVILLFESMNR
jgi:hypothetical protein